MCNDCFISSDHDDHEVFFYYTQSGGCCDCGDTEAWAPEGFCTRHKVRPLVSGERGACASYTHTLD